MDAVAPGFQLGEGLEEGEASLVAGEMPWPEKQSWLPEDHLGQTGEKRGVARGAALETPRVDEETKDLLFQDFVHQLYQRDLLYCLAFHGPP